MKKILYTICCAGLLSVPASAQQSLSTQLLMLPGLSNANPAFLPETEWSVSAPSPEFGMMHSGPSFDKLFEKQASGKYKILGGMEMNQFDTRNVFAAEFTLDLLSAGFRWNNHYVSLQYSMNARAGLNYTRDGIKLLLHGNGPYVGQQLSIGPAIDIQEYDKLGLGYAYNMEQWTIGGRVNLLFGERALVTESDYVGLMTEGDYYALNLTTDYVVHASRFADVDTTTNNVSFADMSYKPGFGNAGFGLGVDLGAVYRMNDEVTLFGAVSDIGRIKWKEGQSFESHGTRRYDGVRIESLATLDTASLAGMLDSIQKFVGLEKSFGAFTSHLSPRIYVGGTWRSNERTTFSGLVDVTPVAGMWMPALALGANYQMADWASVGGMLSFQNKQINHLGLNATVKAGPVRFFMVSDNVLGFLLPRSATSLHFRTGLIFQFGRIMQTSTIYTLG